MANLNLQDILSGTGLGVGDIGKTQTQVAGTNVGDELAIAQTIGDTSNPLLGLLKGEQIFKAREKSTRKGEVEEVLNQIKVAQAEVLQQKNQLENLKKADDAASRVAEQNAVLVGQNLNMAASLGDTPAGNAKVVDALVAAGRKPIGNVQWNRNTGMISGTFLVPDGKGGQSESTLTFRASDLVNSPEAKQALNLTIAGGNEQLLTAQQELIAAPTAGQARLAETEAVLGRQATEAERQAEAGVLQRQATGSPAEFAGTKEAIKTAEGAQRAFADVNTAISQLEAAIDEGVGAGAFGAGVAKGTANMLSSFVNLFAPESDLGDQVQGLVPESIKSAAESRKVISQIGAALPFIVGGALGQSGKSLSDQDRKIMTTIAGELQDLSTSPEQARASLGRLKEFMQQLSQNAFGVAASGAQPQIRTREEILKARGL